MRALRRFLPIVFILALAVGVAGYLRATKPMVEPYEVAERVWPVEARIAVPETVTPTLTAYGTIIAARRLDLRPLVSGLVLEASDALFEGGTVKIGDTLVVIDPFNFEIAVSARQAELTEAQARLAELKTQKTAEQAMLERDSELVDLAARDVKRFERLRQTSVASQKTLDDARVTLSERRRSVVSTRQMVGRLAAQIEQQEAKIEQIKAALRRELKDLERTVVVAPFDAFILNPDVAIGKQVTVNDRLATLVDVDRMEARFFLSARELAQLLASGHIEGRPVEIVWKLGETALTFPAQIQRIGSEIDATAGTIEVRASLSGLTTQTLLRPGAFIEANIQGRMLVNAVRLPLTAIHDGDMVYTIVDSRLVVRPIVVLANEADEVFVGKLDAGDLVVVNQFSEMVPGMRVTASEGPSNIDD